MRVCDTRAARTAAPAPAGAGQTRRARGPDPGGAVRARRSAAVPPPLPVPSDCGTGPSLPRPAWMALARGQRVPARPHGSAAPPAPLGFGGGRKAKPQFARGVPEEPVMGDASPCRDSRVTSCHPVSPRVTSRHLAPGAALVPHPEPPPARTRGNH